TFVELADLDVIDALDVVVAHVDRADPLTSPMLGPLGDARVRLVGVHDNLSDRTSELVRTGGFDILVDIGTGHAAIIDAVTGTSSRSLRRWEPPRLSPGPLTERERTVLCRVAEGNSSREIASTMLISVHTVEN